MTVTIALPDHIQTWIDGEIEAGRFATEQQVIVAALERMADDRTIPPDMLDELLAESIAEADRGDTREFTREVMDELSAQAKVNAELGLDVPDDIKY